MGGCPKVGQKGLIRKLTLEQVSWLNIEWTLGDIREPRWKKEEGEKVAQQVSQLITWIHTWAMISCNELTEYLWPKAPSQQMVLMPHAFCKDFYNVVSLSCDPLLFFLYHSLRVASVASEPSCVCGRGCLMGERMKHSMHISGWRGWDRVDMND